MKQKKLLVLGANNGQVQLIKAAKKEGYYVIACDYTNNNPGLPFVDKHYQVSYLDQEAVLSIAKQENVDGVIGNTDPAMPMVAYIATQLGLVGNKPESIEPFVSKTAFRELQEEVGLYCPKHIESDNLSVIEKAIEAFYFPIIVKPSVSAGTQGTTKIFSNQAERLRDAFQICKSFSRDGKVTIEEYVEMPSLEMIEGDIFVNEDTFLWNIFTTRRSILAPMVPRTYIFPSLISEDESDVIKSSLTKLFKKAGVRHGFYNVEMYFTTKKELFIIEINPRQGGHLIPQLIEQHTGVDCNKLLVTTAAGDFDYYHSVLGKEMESNLVAFHVVFSKYTGYLDKINISPEIARYVTDTIYRKNVSQVTRCENGTHWIAYVTLRFPDRKSQLDYCGEKIDQYVTAEVKDRQIPVVEGTMPYKLLYNFMTGDAYDFFVPKLAKVQRTPEDYAAQFASYCTIAYDLDEDNQIKGMIAGYTHNLRIEGWSYVAEVYVNSAHRGKGLGEELFKAYIDYCKSIHLKGIWLNVKEENIPAQSLYQKLGFVFDESYNEDGYLKMDLKL